MDKEAKLALCPFRNNSKGTSATLCFTTRSPHFFFALCLKVLKLSSYSPDLAAPDFYMFGPLKAALRGYTVGSLMLKNLI